MEKAPLTTADIQLLQLVDGEWEEMPGRGIHNPLTGRFRPGPGSQARLVEPAPVVYVAQIPPAQASALAGKVVDAAGLEVPGIAVLRRTGASVSGPTDPKGLPDPEIMPV